MVNHTSLKMSRTFWNSDGIGRSLKRPAKKLGKAALAFPQEYVIVVVCRFILLYFLLPTKVCKTRKALLL